MLQEKENKEKLWKIHVDSVNFAKKASFPPGNFEILQEVFKKRN